MKKTTFSLVLLVLLCFGTEHLVAQNESSPPIEVTMTYKKIVEKANPVKSVIINAYGADESMIAEARLKVKSVESAGKHVMTKAEYDLMVTRVNARIEDETSDEKRAIMRRDFNEELAQIVVAEELLQINQRK